MFNGSNITPADIAAVMGNNRDGLGDGGDWLILIVLFAMFGGWGGGWGGNAAMAAAPATQADVRAAVDQQTLISKMDQQTYGLSDLGYAIQGQIHGVTDALTNARFGLQQGMDAGFNALTRQMADCCCENRQAIAQVRYDMATQSCELGHKIEAVGQGIHEELTQLRLEQKNERIAELTQQLSAANLAASQVAQNQYLIAHLRPSPIPAYEVPNPYCCPAATTAAA